MLTIVLSLLFGVIAFAALAQICVSVGTGVKHGRAILAELSRQERAPVKSAPWPVRQQWQPALAAA
jgi:hypothetical protein